MSQNYRPLLSLEEGHWFKLICGASFQHLPAVRSLTLAYTLAGADCIDVAADPAVIAAAREGIAVAKHLASSSNWQGFRRQSSPWLMVSLNDGEDPHFRKAEFDSSQCPSTCHRPCESICPAHAIGFLDNGHSQSGVIDQLCYGCGRCLPICPSQLIFTRSYVSTPEAIAPLIKDLGIDALEIHTQFDHYKDFLRLWQAISPWTDKIKLIAISCQDHPNLIAYLSALYELISPLPCSLIWQTDGRPMSGDIGKGTTHATIGVAQKVLESDLPGYVQLAGGTNEYTVEKLRRTGLLKDLKGETFAIPSTSFVHGIAYGSYARSLLNPIISQLENDFHPQSPITKLENRPDLLSQAVQKAYFLVNQLKSVNNRQLT